MYIDVSIVHKMLVATLKTTGDSNATITWRRPAMSRATLDNGHAHKPAAELTERRVTQIRERSSEVNNDSKQSLEKRALFGT